MNAFDIVRADDLQIILSVASIAYPLHLMLRLRKVLAGLVLAAPPIPPQTPTPTP
jgi:hypothetical protein